MYAPGVAARSALVLVVALTLGETLGAQRGQYRTGDRVRDSTAYLRDSAVVDSVARSLPVDSLRALYRRVAAGIGTAETVRELQCASYRLTHTYGYAAVIAERRIREAEWTPERDSVVVTAIDRAAAVRYGEAPDTVPTQAACLGAAPEPPPGLERLLRWRLVAPWHPRRAFPHGTSRDSLRRGLSYFEATLTGRRAGRDTSIEFAGTAGISFHGRAGLRLELQDRLHPRYTFTMRLQHPGLGLLQPGSYVVLEEHDVSGVPGVMSSYVLGDNPLFPHVSDRWGGTLVVERADTVEVHGRADIWIQRAGLRPWRWRLPADSLRDTVRITARFHAVYDWEMEFMPRGPFSLPPYPRRLAAGARPDTGMTARRLFLDEHAPCETLPIFSPESVLPPLPPSSPLATATAALSFRVDTAGRVWRRGIRVLRVDDPQLVSSFAEQPGLRFRRVEPHQVYSTVRCTLTLRRQQ